MEIKGKVHCFFEQSGTFKQEFIKLGIPAFDYDIQDNFGQTDYKIDLFAEIEEAYKRERETVFDRIGPDDLIMAFFPCIYFSSFSQMDMCWTAVNNRNRDIKVATDDILARSKERERFYALAIKMLAVAKIRGLRLIMENPWSMQTYLKANFILPPTFVDSDRTKRGDAFKKPTAYWYINCDPTHGFTEQKNHNPRRILDTKSSSQKGTCSEDRSMLSPDYARNFICDFIIGKEQVGSQLQLDF